MPNFEYEKTDGGMNLGVLCECNFLDTGSEVWISFFGIKPASSFSTVLLGGSGGSILNEMQPQQLEKSPGFDNF